MRRGCQREYDRRVPCIVQAAAGNASVRRHQTDPAGPFRLCRTRNPSVSYLLRDTCGRSWRPVRVSLAAMIGLPMAAVKRPRSNLRSCWTGISQPSGQLNDRKQVSQPPGWSLGSGEDRPRPVHPAQTRRRGDQLKLGAQVLAKTDDSGQLTADHVRRS